MDNKDGLDKFLSLGGTLYKQSSQQLAATQCVPTYKITAAQWMTIIPKIDFKNKTKKLQKLKSVTACRK